ncbi:MAG TPA: PadR family transcriptional regulator [Spirochaetota bacterium]|nr:PadR family transcriptional regulator [Spirochaetota bacterium]HPV39708.1 PadR family transcriptional regulator [Spirochaetota bacterium]
MNKNESANELAREFLLGFIKIHILHHASKEKIYGKEFHEELNRHGYDMSFGTIYPVFHRLEKNGYLLSEQVKVNGKIRKYYTITEKGKKVLNHTKKKTQELFDELNE